MDVGEPPTLVGEVSDIWVARDTGPAVCEDSPAVRVGFAEPDGLHPGSFEAEIEASDSAEKRADIHTAPRNGEAAERASSGCIALSLLDDLVQPDVREL